MKKEVIKLAEQLEKEWMKIHNDWRTPVWGYFRDRAERILDGREDYKSLTLPLVG
jgi:hypothetical protein